MSEEFITPKEKTPEQALLSLKRLCAKAEKSSGDALRLMYKWRIKAEHKHKILQVLLDEKFIDDRRYAEAFTREKLNLSGWGAYKIRAALAAKGVNKQIIDNTLAVLDDDKMMERLSEKLKKKSRTISSPDHYIVRNKMMRYGLSLGYDYQMVSQVVDQLLK